MPSEKSGTQAWVEHHYMRGKDKALDDFSKLRQMGGSYRRGPAKNPSEQMERTSYIQEMKKILGVDDAE